MEILVKRAVRRRVQVSEDPDVFVDQVLLDLEIEGAAYQVSFRADEVSDMVEFREKLTVWTERLAAQPPVERLAEFEGMITL